MVLVTTALEKTFPKDKNEKILFLGEWCKLYSKKNIYEQYEYETLTYHWDDRKKLYEDTKYIDVIYEKYLDILKNNMNKIHKVDFSTSYWRIILGPWLRYFIEMTYDRYLSITEASKQNIDHMNRVNIKCEDITPCDMLEFDKLYIDDIWNQFIYQEIIRYFDIKTIDLNSSVSIKRMNIKRRTSMKNMIKKVLFFLNKFNTIHFFSSYIRLQKLWQLQMKLLQFPTFGTVIDIDINTLYSKDLRNKLSFEKIDSLFEKILSNLIKKQIPKYYLEGYHEFRLKVLKSYPKNAKVIFTANAYSANDAFKFWAAEKKEDGSKYIIGQHGGHYGMGLFSSHEKHQITSSDKFFSWGWKDKNNKSVIPIPAVKLDKSIDCNVLGDILIPMSSFPRYSYHIMAMPISGQVLDYIDNQVDYINLVSENVKSLLKLRLYQHDYRWDFRSRFIDKGFANLIDNDINLKKYFHHRLSECRLCIATYNATTYLETFSANYPTLIYWNPLHWELKEEVKPYFDTLESVGILHYTPMSLALKLNEVYANPLAWWSMEKIQTAKNQFCHIFANKEKNYLVEYKKEIKGKFS